MMQTGKLVKVFVYLKGKRIEIEPDEARALLAQLKATFGESQPQPVFIPVPQYPQPIDQTPAPFQPWYPVVTCGSQQ